MFVFLLVALILTSEFFEISGATERQGIATFVPCLQNAIPLEDLLFETTERSRFACSLQCLDHEGCKTFTYMTPSATCRGLSSVPTTESPSCPSPWAETWSYGNCSRSDYTFSPSLACIKVITSAQLKWQDANNSCAQESAHLIRLRTTAERDLLVQVLTGLGVYPGIEFWTDARSLVPGTVPVWGDESNTTVDGNLWGPTEPDDLDSDFCVRISSDSSTGLSLRTKTCESPYEFICQLDQI
ncbi:hypothetical protein BaRGS_00018717 [Batillaria attramentaria]|uniref:C-type lectin domain-containing protein n=1 Tax=Batillaria attramentaria TaxID=370345 RepID=A0ABD0KTB4_9CAEN